jgi:hypothetical protein
LYTEPEYKQHKLEVCSTEAKNGGWGVEVTVSWQDGITEKRTKYGLSRIHLTGRRSILGDNPLHKLD